MRKTKKKELCYKLRKTILNMNNLHGFSYVAYAENVFKHF